MDFTANNMNYGCEVTFQSDWILNFSLSEDNPSEKSHILTLKEGAKLYCIWGPEKRSVAFFFITWSSNGMASAHNTL